MLSELVTVLHSARPELTAEEIADAIWLARYMREADDNVSAQPASEQMVPKSSDSTATKAEEPQPVSTPLPTNSDLYLTSHENEDESGSQMGSLPFRSPAAPALLGTLNLARALRPFKRHIPSRTGFMLNEGATAERIAEAGLWIPVLDSTLTRWLEVALVVDESPSMAIWRRTIDEFRQLLEREGAFRNVRTYGLSTDASDGKVSVNTNTAWSLQNRRECSPLELVEPGGQRLILVVTDCVSEGWDRDNGQIVQMLAMWGKSNPVTIVQVLPQRLWIRTALRTAVPVRLRALTPGMSNTQLIAQTTNYWDDEEPLVGLPVPIVTLEQRSLSAWARAIARAEDVWIPGFMLDTTITVDGKTEIIEEFKQKDRLPVLLSPQERVKRFRATASPTAYKLASLLATVPVSLPVIRLIQQTMLHESRQTHVAEVLLGGLLKEMPSKHTTSDPDYKEYDFIEGTRDLLLDSLTVGESFEVLSNYIESHFGQSFDFPALLANPHATEGVFIGKNARSFARVSVKALHRLGGKYAALANQLVEASVKAEEGVYESSIDQVRGSSQETYQGIKIAEMRETEAQVVVPFEQENIVEQEGVDREHIDVSSEITAEQTIEEAFPIIEQLQEEQQGIALSDMRKDFLISYHPTDINWADWIAWQLEEAGYAVELEAWVFQPGANFAGEVDKAIQTARHVIVILSPDYLQALYKIPGWITAFFYDPRSDNEQNILLAIQVRECISELQELLGKIVYTDLVGLKEVAARKVLLDRISYLPDAIVATSLPSNMIYHSLPEQPHFPGIPSAMTEVELFISYAPEDETLGQELYTYLTPLQRNRPVSFWSPRDIIHGKEKVEQIRNHLNAAQIILLLISAHYLSSDDIYQQQVLPAMERYRKEQTTVILVLLRPIDWEDEPFGKLPALPTNKVPITLWNQKNEAWRNVVQSVRQTIDSILSPSATLSVEDNVIGSLQEEVPTLVDSSSPTFDVFLCYNSQDRDAVKGIGNQLKARGIRPWLDEWELRPGQSWRQALEEQMANINSVAIFVGKGWVDEGGRELIGPWQRIGTEALLQKFVNKSSPVIPVLLQDSPEKPQLPLFLKNVTWVDFRKSDPDPLDQLIWGITGVPNAAPATLPDAVLAQSAATALAGLREEVEKDYHLADKRVAGAKLLWVDDLPENNVSERKAMEAAGIQITLSLSTEDALEKVRAHTYDVIISDMGRLPPGPQPPYPYIYDDLAGYTLLDKLRDEHIFTPFIIYTSFSSARDQAETRRRGGFGTTSDPQVLFQMVIDAIEQSTSRSSAKAETVVKEVAEEVGGYVKGEGIEDENIAAEGTMEKLLPWYERLRHERLQRVWTQVDIANRIGCNPKSVARWEKGESFPNSYFRQRLSELYRKSVEELGLIEDIDFDRGAGDPDIEDKTDGKLPDLAEDVRQPTEQVISRSATEAELPQKMEVLWKEQGDVHGRDGRLQEALEAYNHALEIDPSYREAYNSRGMVYYQLGQYQQALADCSRAIELDPDNAATYSNRGLTYFQLRNYQQAVFDYNRSIELNPEFAAAYVGRGSVYYALRNYERAIYSYQQALRIYTQEAFPTEWANVQANLGDAYNMRAEGSRQDNLERAIACYQAALQSYAPETFPTQWATLQQKLGDAFSAYSELPNVNEQENLEKAIAYYKQVLPIESYVDPSLLVVENAYQQDLFANLAQEIASFPEKQRTAILIDLANRMDFGELPTALQRAFLGVGIQLKGYQRPLPTDARERARHASLLSIAYKRLRGVIKVND